MIKYTEPLFRPPAEADSLIFQVARGCPHNSCRFCGMYKTVRYSERDREEVLAEFREGGRLYPETRRIFLADGDVMSFSFERLREMLQELNRSFSRLSRVNIYANGSSILAKTEAELKELRSLKLNTLYMGLETGSQELLGLVGKQENVDDMVKAVQLAQASGFRCSVMVLLGLGGKLGSEAHAEQTAEALNKMQPLLLSALRYIEVPGSSRFNGYTPSTEYEAALELRGLIEQLELEKTIFRANHSSNPIPLGGRFPQDKDNLLEQIDIMLKSGSLDRKGPGLTPFYL